MTDLGFCTLGCPKLILHLTPLQNTRPMRDGNKIKNNFFKQMVFIHLIRKISLRILSTCMYIATSTIMIFPDNPNKYLIYSQNVFKKFQISADCSILVKTN